jgi:hypothetical protein
MSLEMLGQMLEVRIGLLEQKLNFTCINPYS